MYDATAPFRDYTVAALESIVEHLRPGDQARLHLLAADDNDASQREAERVAWLLSQRPGVQHAAMRVMHLERLRDTIGKLSMSGIRQVTGSLLLKLAHHVLLTQTLPSCVHIVLMIDTDVVVLTDLRANVFVPYAATLRDAPDCAVVHGKLNPEGKYKDIVNLERLRSEYPHLLRSEVNGSDAFYGNGMFLANLSKWRALGIGEFMLQLIQAHVASLSSEELGGKHLTNGTQPLLKRLQPNTNSYGSRVTQSLMALALPPGLHCSVSNSTQAADAISLSKTCRHFQKASMEILPWRTKLNGTILHTHGPNKLAILMNRKPCERWVKAEWQALVERGYMLLQGFATPAKSTGRRLNIASPELQLPPRGLLVVA